MASKTASKMNKPLVSICLPIYNGDMFLCEALESIRAQTYPNLELIISDDNSVDSSLVIIDEFKKNVNFPVLVFHHQPSGIGANWNNCIVNSNGEYIKFLFQDDILASSCIEKMVAQAVKCKNIGMVYSKRDFLFDSDDTKSKEWIKLYGNLHLSWKKNSIIDGIVNRGIDLLKDPHLLNFPLNKIGEPTAVLIKKDVFDKVGYFSEVLKQELDNEFWYRLMKKYNVVFIDEKLLSFRLHNNQTTVINTKNELNETNLFFYIMYQKLFWNLCFNTQIKLFYAYNTFGKILKIIFNLVNSTKRRIIKKIKCSL